MKGKFILFEGIDSSGKKTQANLLAERLRKIGKKVEIIRFPTYKKTPLGILVAKYLKGDFGSKEEITPEIGSLFYSLDRHQFQKEIKEKLEAGINVIADRYTASNIFQAAKLEGEKRFEIWEWIKDIDRRLPQPDATIVLNVPTKISKKLSLEKEQKNVLMRKGEIDIHEADENYQEKVRRTYLDIAEKENWIVINCCKEKEEEFEFITPEKIHDKIFEELKGLDIF
ncbi:MAG: dTMP kinase [Candidatus Aenigmarchaeota archaeon]|nr:dTMP kinase [Candidatus Aenigmarchaeota archaeon]